MNSAKDRPTVTKHRGYVTKLEIGTKSQLLKARDFKAKERRREQRNFERSLAQRSSLRSEPSVNRFQRAGDRYSLRSERSNRPKSVNSGHFRRNDHLEQGSGRALHVSGNPSFVNRIQVTRDPSRSWPGSSYSVPPVSPLPGGGDSNRCFAIRHAPLGPIGEEAERGHDSIVTTSLLQLTSFSPPSDSLEDGEDGGEAVDNKEDMDKEGGYILILCRF